MRGEKRKRDIEERKRCVIGGEERGVDRIG
jgi:hypothetical protein